MDFGEPWVVVLLHGLGGDASSMADLKRDIEKLHVCVVTPEGRQPFTGVDLGGKFVAPSKIRNATGAWYEVDATVDHNLSMLQSFAGIDESVRQILDAAFAVGPFADVIVVGHSQGGSMAFYMATHPSEESKRVRACVSMHGFYPRLHTEETIKVPMLCTTNVGDDEMFSQKIVTELIPGARDEATIDWFVEQRKSFGHAISDLERAAVVEFIQKTIAPKPTSA